MTAGFGLDWLDVAFGLTTYKQRIVSTSTTGLNGNYRAKVVVRDDDGDEVDSQGTFSRGVRGEAELAEVFSVSPRARLSATSA